MSKELTPLQAWERANNNAYEHGYEISGDLCYIIETALNDAEKYKKALEIITKKGIKAVKYFTKFYLVDKNDNLLCEISKEEYDLLKEILKWNQFY